MSLPTVLSRAVLSPRSAGISPGAIAGAVIGSVVGGSVLLLVLGFLYFRWKRKTREAHAEEALANPKGSDLEPDAFLHRQGVLPAQPAAYPARVQPLILSNGGPEGGLPLPPSQQESSTAIFTDANGHAWTGDQASQAIGYDPIPLQDIDFSLPGRQHTFPVTTDHISTSPLGHAATAPAAANSSYYDMSVPMEDDPAQASIPPSRQMSDLYEAQKREAEEYYKDHSFQKRLWHKITHRQDTRSSHKTNGSSDQAVSIKQEPGLETARDFDWPQVYAEPNQMTPTSMTSSPMNVGPQGGQRQQSQHEQGRLPQDGRYIDPGDRVLASTERDPALPSSVIRSDSTNWFPPEPLPDTQPHSPTPERLKSPEIPEPMNIDGYQPEDSGHSPFRQSKSPRLPNEQTVNPMAAFVPTNAVEKAAYNTYQIKHSESPPDMASSPPEIVTQQPTQEDLVNSPSPTEEDLEKMYLQLPDDDDENRRSSDSYEYPVTPGQSSTGYSSGRTPDTRPTVSPPPVSTVPQYQNIKSETTYLSSPEATQTSNLATTHICTECNRSFDQIHKLNHHKRYHDRTHECPYQGCERKFGTKTHLDRHINDRHLKSKAYHCTDPTCPWFKGGKSFPRKDNWRRHMMKKHGTTQQDFAVIEEMVAMDMS
ncbi:hypothetical protein F5Y16DRAFT_83738 [Xylariaceae sp. FL0255]|nr:hypothetical protein F5Y16DRAFT_83738 [Xylariaceae sp. FL0255]